MNQDIAPVHEIVRTSGLHGALAWLNARTPHRFTGVFQFRGTTLRNVCLVDRFDPQVKRGTDIPVAHSYCSRVEPSGGTLQFEDIARISSVPRMPGPVVSYCGVQIRTSDGRAWGTLCHFDFQPCQERLSDKALLLAFAPLVLDAVAAGETCDHPHA